MNVNLTPQIKQSPNFKSVSIVQVSKKAFANPVGTPKKDAQGNLIYKSGSYESALAAALAENGVITAADGDATINKTKDGSSISITNMCNAIYRNDSSAREFIDYIDEAIDNVSLRCTKIGAYMNRLECATLLTKQLRRVTL